MTAPQDELTLDELTSQTIAQQIKSKAKTPFDNAYKAALATQDATYVQGFLIIGGHPNKLVEHSWIEVADRIVDPTWPHFNKTPDQLHYIAAQRLTVKKLKALVEEAQEDYPDDPPLPIYGNPPYEYYGDVMLGGQDYLTAYQTAEAQIQALNLRDAEKN